MAANGASFVEAKKILQGFMIVLEYAACELFLNFLLLIDAVFSYLLTKFARRCQLQIPCILCARLDHILGNEKPGFYQNLLCSNHRTEISSLFSCCIHGKLADGRGMCEECLLSSTTKTKSNPDMHRLLVGKFGFDLSAYGCQSSVLNREFISGSVGMRLCSCCNKPWGSRKNADKLRMLKSPRSGMNMPNIPLPRRLTHREDLKKMRERFSGSATPYRLGKIGIDQLSHVGYMELKFASDSESEFPFSDDDEDRSIFREMKEPKEESIILHASEVLPKTLTNIVAPNKLPHKSSKQHMQPDVGEPQDVKNLQSDSDRNCEHGRLNWQQVDQKTYPSAIPELISLDDFPPLSNGMEASNAVSIEQNELLENSNPSPLSELMALVDAPSSFHIVEGSLEASKLNSDITGTTTGGNVKRDIRSVPINNHEEILKLAGTREQGVKNDQFAKELPPTNPTYMDRSDVGKSTVNGLNEAFGVVAVKQPIEEPEKIYEDMKSLPTENASAQGVGLPPDKKILDNKSYGDKLQVTDASSSNGVQRHEDTIKMEGNESSSHESLVGSFVSEFEGGNAVDQLKQQIEYDKKCIDALYKELEEERSAAAIAANQAMAMITRLQEEKAALHMEALQYLRMMEEQAEYDVEALEKANDLLAEKEKEIQDLEADIEHFMLKFRDEPMVETVPEENCYLKGKNTKSDNTNISYAKGGVNVLPSPTLMEVSNDQENPVAVRSLWLEFQDEKLFISQWLKDLEKKFHQLSQYEASPYMSGRDSEEPMDRGANKREFVKKEETQINDEMNEKESSLSMQQDLSVSDESFPAHEKFNASTNEDQIVGEQRKHKEIDLVTLENEISDLNERLEALESNWNFLEHTLNSLNTGKEGVKFVQEIAYQLRELRQKM